MTGETRGPNCWECVTSTSQNRLHVPFTYTVKETLYSLLLTTDHHQYGLFCCRRKHSACSVKLHHCSMHFGSQHRYHHSQTPRNQQNLQILRRYHHSA